VIDEHQVGGDRSWRSFSQTAKPAHRHHHKTGAGDAARTSSQWHPRPLGKRPAMNAFRDGGQRGFPPRIGLATPSTIVPRRPETSLRGQNRRAPSSTFLIALCPWRAGEGPCRVVRGREGKATEEFPHPGNASMMTGRWRARVGSPQPGADPHDLGQTGPGKCGRASGNSEEELHARRAGLDRKPVGNCVKGHIRVGQWCSRP